MSVPATVSDLLKQRESIVGRIYGYSVYEDHSERFYPITREYQPKPEEELSQFLERLCFDPTPNRFGHPGVLSIEVYESLAVAFAYHYAAVVTFGNGQHLIFIHGFIDLLQLLTKLVPLADWGKRTLEQELLVLYGEQL